MAKSSIHISAGNLSYFLHNDRSKKTKNSIFSDEENIYSKSAKEAIKIFRDEINKRSEAYFLRTGQKIQKNVVQHLSAIINLNKHHSLYDVQKVGAFLEEKLGTKVCQISVHRDEGHVEDGKPIKNYHAHLEFLGLDQQVKSVRRKLTKNFLRELQTFTAKILGMERGQKNSKKDGLTHTNSRSMQNEKNKKKKSSWRK